jgi:hypothetical protein
VTGRQGLRETLYDYDAIACCIDKTDDGSLLDPKEELNSMLSADGISQLIVVLGSDIKCIRICKRY